MPVLLRVPSFELFDRDVPSTFALRGDAGVTAERCPLLRVDGVVSGFDRVEPTVVALRVPVVERPDAAAVVLLVPGVVAERVPDVTVDRELPAFKLLLLEATVDLLDANACRLATPEFRCAKERPGFCCS